MTQAETESDRLGLYPSEPDCILPVYVSAYCAWILVQSD